MSDKFICDFPWVHLSVFPQGNCTVCCVAKHSGKGNGHSWNRVNEDVTKTVTVMNSTIPEIVNCDNYKTIRLDNRFKQNKNRVTTIYAVVITNLSVSKKILS